MRDKTLQMTAYNAIGDIACQHPGRTTVRTSILRGTARTDPVSEQSDKRPWEASGGEAGAEERVVDKGLCSEAYERMRREEGLLRWYLPYCEDSYAA